MAEPLSHEAQHGGGHNVLGGLTREEFFEFLQRYDQADFAITEAVGERKSLRAEIKGRGVPLRAWDRARKDSGISGEKRELEEMAYRQMMAWQLKPSGFQASLDLDLDPVLNDRELAWIEQQGVDAGRNGRRRDSNSYTPGTAAHVQWDNGWLDGSAGEHPNGEAAADPPKRRGRPRGSKNRSAEAQAEQSAGETEPGPAEGSAEQQPVVH